MVEVRAAVGAEDVDQVRGLMREYGAYLAGGPAQICLGGLEDELGGLPGVYVAPGGLWLGWLDGVAAGCIAMKPLGRTRAADQAPAANELGLALELKRLWVRPVARGHGLGRGLMDAAIAAAREAGARAVYLDTVPGAMAEAHALYAQIGFEPVERYNQNSVNGVEFFRLRLG